MGEELVPEEISKLLSAVPTSAYAKGHQYPSGSSGRIATKKSGMWRLRAKEAEPEDLDGQVSELLGQVTSDLSVWGTSRRGFALICSAVGSWAVEMRA
ncbi:DUF4279 domain-containing protein [Comamonas terrae]|uniref:DUF4279 domain-containing protein n=1 Tax=Comamonas terrae TaxID=673548 RepID=A0ABW5UKQ5_9BURK|nr:DUF4279 domain-containing protein [Comamonas terrae]